MSGDERVGRIYKLISPRYPGLAWLWAINRAGYASRMEPEKRRHLNKQSMI
jgi:hypothetical protein